MHCPHGIFKTMALASSYYCMRLLYDWEQALQVGRHASVANLGTKLY